MKSFQVRVLSPDQVRNLYAQRLTEDFPPDELKPLSAIERAMARGAYICYGAVDGRQILAYAFFVTLQSEQSPVALVDYFAVRADLRDRGMGSRFLQTLISGPLRAYDVVLLEVDDPSCAEDSLELEIRNRRLRFYLGNGLVQTDVTATVFGVRFRLLALPVGPLPAPEKTRSTYARLYREMLPPDIYAEKVRIDGGDAARS